MKKNELKVLSELMKDSRISDREMARKLGISQPTANRTRKKLEEEGYIREYAAFPDFKKLGYEIMAVSLAKAKITLTTEEQETAKNLVLTNPKVIFVASGDGIRKNGIMVSLHKNYADYIKFMTNLKSKSFSYMEEVEILLIDLKSNSMLKPPSMSCLTLDILLNKDNES